MKKHCFVLINFMVFSLAQNIQSASMSQLEVQRQSTRCLTVPFSASQVATCLLEASLPEVDLALGHVGALDGKVPGAPVPANQGTVAIYAFTYFNQNPCPRAFSYMHAFSGSRNIG